MKTLKKLTASKLGSRKGATMLEYALIVSMISIAAIGSLPILKNKISQSFSQTASSFQ